MKFLLIVEKILSLYMCIVQNVQNQWSVVSGQWSARTEGAYRAFAWRKHIATEFIRLYRDRAKRGLYRAYIVRYIALRSRRVSRQQLAVSGQRDQTIELSNYNHGSRVYHQSTGLYIITPKVCISSRHSLVYHQPRAVYSRQRSARLD